MNAYGKGRLTFGSVIALLVLALPIAVFAQGQPGFAPADTPDITDTMTDAARRHSAAASRWLNSQNTNANMLGFLPMLDAARQHSADAARWIDNLPSEPTAPILSYNPMVDAAYRHSGGAARWIDSPPQTPATSHVLGDHVMVDAAARHSEAAARWISAQD